MKTEGPNHSRRASGADSCRRVFTVLEPSLEDETLRHWVHRSRPSARGSRTPHGERVPTSRGGTTGEECASSTPTRRASSASSNPVLTRTTRPEESTTPKPGHACGLAASLAAGSTNWSGATPFARANDRRGLAAPAFTSRTTRSLLFEAPRADAQPTPFRSPTSRAHLAALGSLCGYGNDGVLWDGNRVCSTGLRKTERTVEPACTSGRYTRGRDSRANRQCRIARVSKPPAEAASCRTPVVETNRASLRIDEPPPGLRS